MASEQSPIHSQPEQEQAPSSGSAPIAAPPSPVAGIINIPQINAPVARYVLPLYNAVDSGDWKAAKRFLDASPQYLTLSITPYDDTLLHIAALHGREKFVRELVEMMQPKDLEIRAGSGDTALLVAACVGNPRTAAHMVKKNPNLLSIPNMPGEIPVVVAANYGHKHMVHYLYSETPDRDLNPDTHVHGAMLLMTCISIEFFDIALDLIRRYPKLACWKDIAGDTALKRLMSRPSAFPSGSRLAFWQRWIYHCIHVQLHPIRQNLKDLEKGYQGHITKENTMNKALTLPIDQLWNVMQYFGFKHIYDTKLKHVEALKLLRSICQELSVLDLQQLDQIEFFPAIFYAAENGIVELFIEVRKFYPEAMDLNDPDGRSVFQHATLKRQHKVLSLLYTRTSAKPFAATKVDNGRNSLLHLAAILAPSNQLDRISGAALQMQRELQWYKEAESIVQPKLKETVNADNKTPRVLFIEQHEKLREDGEKWMKDTATSSTVVAALIATIMFAAAFTIPSGTNGHTYMDYFMVFIVSDALSLFSSSTSVLMFLGILTSRYTEEDFLKSLPTKLIIGLSTLFFSIVTMMITFGTTVVIVLREKLSWILIPIVLFASIPVTLFALLQFPILVEIFLSTYGPSIFDRPRKCWCC